MKRHTAAPEEYVDAGPLFAMQQARARADIGMTRAAGKAERIEPAWQSAALLTLHAYAQEHVEPFLAEQIGISVPHDADRRAIGSVLKRAERLGWIRAAGFGAATSSNGSPKVLWRSLICTSHTGGSLGKAQS